MLTDGPDNPAFWEHRRIAELLDVPLIEPGELDAAAVDVLYRRTNGDRLDDLVGRTYDLGRAEVLEEALDRLDELVVKPRAGYGGEGVVICPHAERADVERIRADVEASPEDYIAQELVPLSCHPTVIDGALEPRHVDLRPFVFLGADGAAGVLAGGLTRVAFDDGALVVNSSQNGGGKDTWVM